MVVIDLFFVGMGSFLGCCVMDGGMGVFVMLLFFILVLWKGGEGSFGGFVFSGVGMWSWY